MAVWIGVELGVNLPPWMADTGDWNIFLFFGVLGGAELVRDPTGECLPLWIITKDSYLRLFYPKRKNDERRKTFRSIILKAGEL